VLGDSGCEDIPLRSSGSLELRMGWLIALRGSQLWNDFTAISTLHAAQVDELTSVIVAFLKWSDMERWSDKV